MNSTLANRFHLPLLAFASVVLVCGAAQAAPYVVGDSQFVAGVYDFNYRTATNVADNGGTPVAGAPWLTNVDWTRDDRVGVWYWRMPGSDFQRYTGAGATGTIGFDFSGMTTGISHLEIDPVHLLFTYFGGLGAPGTAFDTIRGEVATPASFGTGVFAEMYSHTGHTGGAPPSAVGQRVTDVTPFLSPSWLANPGLLEFRFSYEQSLPIGAKGPEDLGAIAENVQIFRDDSSSTVGFLLSATAGERDPGVPEPATMVLAGLSACGLGAYVRRRRKA